MGKNQCGHSMPEIMLHISAGHLPQTDTLRQTPSNYYNLECTVPYRPGLINISYLLKMTFKLLVNVVL